ncbi:MAG: thiamine pyrophosphate-dependent enzyme [Clostridiales bacterium]|nr:thiamine pyrophosphate-dependent enzyme [Clostridiales bacterium]MCI6613833.1 thiamine pyrophosphate-dependent enzyme [Clostridiales bacterium]
MKPVFEYTKGMRETELHYCPGCTHGIAHRLIMEVLEERGDLGNCIAVSPVGCSIVAHQYMNVDMIESPHGRAPAVASGIKRVHPNSPVFTYQGDGDLASIGTNEIIHAAERGEKFCTFFINNAIYGMTGGQMAPTTLIGQKATTCVEGRTVEQAGMPMRMCELISVQDRAVYVERVSLDSPANVRKAKSAIRRAFKVQDLKLGFAFVEFLSICPTNWGLSAPKSMEWLRENMMPYYPVKQFKCPEEVKEVK